MDDYCKRMVPWHIQEARRDIRKRDFWAAEMNIAIAEKMLNGTWFSKREFKRTLFLLNSPPFPFHPATTITIKVSKNRK